MNDINELERRILYALERIATCVNAQADTDTPGPDTVALRSETERLTTELETERTTNAQLVERVRAIKERQETMVSALESRVARLTQSLDAVSAELQRQRGLNERLNQTNQSLAQAARAGVSSPELLNAALETELAALRAARAAEIAEMEEILIELKPLIGEVA